MEKEFVPYELAVKLKELGFDEPCVGYYHLNEGYTKGYAFCYFNEPKRYESDSAVLTPTFSQAFRWFREKHNIDAWVQPFVSDEEIYELAEKMLSVDYLSFTEGAKWMRDKIKGGNNE
jgi:hypothetical protein